MRFDFTHSLPPSGIIWYTAIGKCDSQRSDMIGHNAIRHVQTVNVVLPYLARIFHLDVAILKFEPITTNVAVIA